MKLVDRVVAPVLASSRTFTYAAVLRSVAPSAHLSLMVFAGALLFLTGCAADAYVPVEKTATYDASMHAAVPPHPCPDWSHAADVNYDNSLHSNYGCAVNNNIAVQLENPRDLVKGRGSKGGFDLEGNVRTIELYRAGEIPLPLEPQQTTTIGQ